MKKTDFVFPGLKTKYLPLLFLTAFRAEAEALFRIHPFQLIEQEKKIHLYHLPPEPIFLLITGPGPSSLDRWLEHTAPVLLVNFGICGGLDLALPLFQNFLVRQVSHLDDPVISTEIHFPDFPEQLLTFFSACRLLSSDYPVLQESLRKKLYQQSGCQLLDMEGYSLAKAAQKYAIPIILLKHLTDYCDESAASSIRENRSIWKIGLQNGLIKLLEIFSEFGDKRN